MGEGDIQLLNWKDKERDGDGCADVFEVPALGPAWRSPLAFAALHRPRARLDVFGVLQRRFFRFQSILLCSYGYEPRTCCKTCSESQCGSAQLVRGDIAVLDATSRDREYNMCGSRVREFGQERIKEGRE